jgi:hypothetical protein
MKMKNQELIDAVIDDFDFTKVRQVMYALSWTWQNAKDGVPSVRELRQSARRHLEDALTGDTGYSFSGGLEATYTNEVLRLKFILEYSEYPLD